MKIILILCALVIAFSAASQIEGAIYDQKSLAVPNVLVSAMDSATKKTDSTRSDTRGFYSFKSLKPATYFIEVKVKGFMTVKQTVIIGPEYKESRPGDEDMYDGERLDIYLKPSR